MKVTLLFLGLIVFTLGHGGVYYPTPRGGSNYACSPTNQNSTVCGQTVSPCGSLVADMGPYSYATIGSTFELLFFQLFGHANAANYYEVLLLNTTSGNYVSLGKTPQSNGTDGITVPISVTIPANFPQNLKTSLQVLFNAGASGTYYSCADLWLSPYCPQKTCLKNIGDACAVDNSPGAIPAECDPKTAYCNAKNVCAAWSAGATCYGTCDQPDDSSSNPIVNKATPPKFYCKITGASGVCTATTTARAGAYCNEANGVYCPSGYFCYYSNQTCQPFRVYGETCSIKNDITDTLCTPTLSCLNNTCNFPYFGNQGEKCAYDRDCAPGLGCNAALGNTCDSPVNVGSNCTLNNADVCYSGSSCSCSSVDATNVTCVDNTFPSACVSYLRTFNDCVKGKTTHTWNECINEASCAYSCSLVQNPMYSYSTGNCYTATQLTDCTTPPDTTTDGGTTGSDAARIFASLAVLLAAAVATLL